MRKRFWIGSIICLFATFSIFIVLARGNDHEDCKGPQICAGARVYGGSKLFAWARASSPNSVDGRWGYKVVAGNKQKGPLRGVYYSGYRRSWEVSDYTANATAYGENTGQARDGKIYFASKSASSGG